jgi:hypothetical protein
MQKQKGGARLIWQPYPLESEKQAIETTMIKHPMSTAFFIFVGLMNLWCQPSTARASTQPRDLKEVLQAGVLRHLGVPYANFVTGSGDGLDVELIQLFAGHLGVRYEYVNSSWKQVIGEQPIRGDLIANGFTMLPWREKIID